MICPPLLDVFLVGPRTTGHILLVALKFFEGFFKKLWYNAKGLYEFNLVIYYSLRKKSNREKIPRA